MDKKRFNFNLAAVDIVFKPCDLCKMNVSLKEYFVDSRNLGDFFFFFSPSVSERDMAVLIGWRVCCMANIIWTAESDHKPGQKCCQLKIDK